MDPNATLQRIADALADGEPEEVVYACEDLQEWLGKGGYPPSPTSPALATAWEFYRAGIETGYFTLHPEYRACQRRYLRGLAETPMESAVMEWAIEEEYSGDAIADAYAWLEDLCEHGCASGMVGDLIYTVDAAEWYERHAEEIDADVAELVESTGMGVDKLLSQWDETDPFARGAHNRNILAWFGCEEAARRLLDRIEEGS